MNTWVRWLHLVLTIGGGAAGIATALFALPGAIQKPLLVIVAAAFIAFYAFGIYVGIQLARGRETRTSLLWFYGAQLPVLSSPILMFFVFSGANLNVGFVGGRLFANWALGSHFAAIWWTSAPWGLGINLVGLAMLALTLKMPSNYRLERP